MKIANILNFIKIIVSVTEQAVQIITESNIPQEQQQQLNQEIEKATKNLSYAQKMIPVKPEEESA